MAVAFPDFVMDINKLRAELTRAIQGKAKWEDLTNVYLCDLIEFKGLSFEDANEVHKGIAFRFYEDGTEKCVQITEHVHGTEVLLTWDTGLDE